MTRRLWIRAHALRYLADLASRHGMAATGSGKRRDPNDMIVVEIPDELAPLVMRDGYLLAAGKVLNDGEEPPYLGSDPGTMEATEKEG